MPQTPTTTTTPSLCPSPRELDDLELLASGALAPLTGFEGATGAVTLHVPADVAEAAQACGSLQLVDPEGAPLATVEVDDTYPVGALVGVTGAVRDAHPRQYGAFRRLYLSPAETRASTAPDALAVPLTRPPTIEDLAEVRARAQGRPVLLLPIVGTGLAEVSPVALVRTALAAAAHLPDASVVAVPLAAHGSPEADAELRSRVLSAYAPQDVYEPRGEGALPDDIAAMVEFEHPGRPRQGLVVFFTGLSGSGKSTLARALQEVVLEQGERTVTSLDGDVVRRHLSAGLSFSKEDRETNIARIGWVAAEISRHGGMAICSPIAPFDSTRRQVRGLVAQAGGAFVLVHVATPLEECERRDRKGLYAKARRGEIPEFTGISSPYEVPEDADLRVDTTGRSITDALDEVLDHLYDAGYLIRGDVR